VLITVARVVGRFIETIYLIVFDFSGWQFPVCFMLPVGVLINVVQRALSVFLDERARTREMACGDRPAKANEDPWDYRRDTAGGDRSRGGASERGVGCAGRRRPRWACAADG
jgi:hypothetical protein